MLRPRDPQHAAVGEARDQVGQATPQCRSPGGEYMSEVAAAGAVRNQGNLCGVEAA